jgi:hypothetical protein
MSLRSFSRVKLSTLLSLLLLLGCGAEEDDQPIKRPSRKSADQERIDRLRSIGYAEVSTEESDPADSGVQHHERRRSAPGYNLYTNRFTCSVVLMDAEGHEVNRWEHPQDRSWSNCKLMPNGDLIVIGQSRSSPYIGAIDEHRYLTRLSWEGDVLWRREINAHHDFEVLDDGRIAVLGFRRNPDSGLGDGIELREDTVHLLGTDGQELEWRSLYEVLRSNPQILEVAAVEPVEKPTVHYQDLIHANSVEFLMQPAEAEPQELFAPGKVLVSSRHQDTVFIFDWKSGELVWAWGPGELQGPHDATLLANGNILIFDNGLGRGWSRALELDPIKNEIVWEFRAENEEDFYTASRGSAQRLSNGNTLLAESDRSRAFEVTPSGRIVWYWSNPERNDRGQQITIVRMKRLPLALVDGILEEL